MIRDVLAQLVPCFGSAPALAIVTVNSAPYLQAGAGSGAPTPNSHTANSGDSGSRWHPKRLAFSGSIQPYRRRFSGSGSWFEGGDSILQPVPSFRMKSQVLWISGGSWVLWRFPNSTAELSHADRTALLSSSGTPGLITKP
jgi:hypothetical protein